MVVNKLVVFLSLCILLYHEDCIASSLDFKSSISDELPIDDYSDDFIVKKKNIPVVPPGALSSRASGVTGYTGGHPVVRAFVSDRPKYYSKKTKIPGDDALINPEQESISEPGIGNRGSTLREKSKRFDLYPKWYLHRIPAMFGKQFAKSYFHPFARKEATYRNQIARQVSQEDDVGVGGVHELPLSWAQPHRAQLVHSDNEHRLPLVNKNAIMSGILPQLANSMPELVDIPDDVLSHHGMRAVPYELMNQLNPNSYEPIQGNPHAQWSAFDDLPSGHFHRHPMNPCHHNPCMNHGKCHFTHQSHRMYNFKCMCNKGFFGHYCEVSPFSCHPSPCQNGGTCTKTKTLVFCSCLPDFKGHHCDEEKICMTNPCMNDGICTETNTGFHCQCQSTFIGRTCEERINVCENNPCKNGGTCRDLEADAQFECTCPTGFGCVDCSCPIEISAFESNSMTGHEVTGLSTTGGINTANLAMHPETHTCPADTCHNGGTCIRGATGFLCNCPVGFHGLNCATPDLCTPNPCQNSGVCVQEGDENYKCICPYGYKGTDCQLRLSCTGHPCMNEAICIETSDSFHCKCTSGYKGIKCTEISPCSHNPCLHKSTCFEKGTMYACKCSQGYRGRTCQENDPCFPNPCSNGQCMERRGAVMCKCNEGWLGDMCDVEDLCHQQNHCLNGGTCVHRYSEFRCLCTQGFKGDTCEIRRPCYDNPCENEGICEEDGDMFVCKCSTGFHGEKCHMQSHCYPNPCENDGRCYESNDNFVCDCPHSFLGKTCNEERFCMSNPCLNGGHCIEVADVYRCKCPLGYFGRKCDISVCDHNPCRNGGTCMPANTESGFACECVFPYHGHQCDEMDACVPNPCRHGGICHSHLQHIQEMSYHQGPQFHGSDESVVSVVGPISNETFHHEPYYDIHDHSLKYVPDENIMTNAVDHFHMTSDAPHHVYADQLYNSKYEDHNHHGSNDVDYHGYNDINHHGYNNFDHHDPTHNGLYPDHRLEDDLVGLHIDDKRSFVNVTKKSSTTTTIKRSHVHKQKHARKLRHKKKQMAKARSSIDLVPQIMINIRNTKSTIVKRTMHDLYVCECGGGFLGAHCQHINPCDSNPCHNNGNCVPRGEIYQCQCVNGFGGANCDDPHPCSPNPCLHDGKCLLAHNVHGYACQCGPEWRGNNCENRDMCIVHNPCLHGALCVNVEEGKVECNCRARFTGDRCEIDKCSACDPNAYCHHGNCICKPSFIGNGFKCRSIGDVCVPNPCDNDGVCQHGVDGKLFSCECQHGFLGARCELPNPCAINPCLHNGACIDASNSKDKGILMADRSDYKCFCTPGYRGKNCEETNLAACMSAPCQNRGYCFDASSESHKKHLEHADDYECFCAVGFSGKNCEYEHYPCLSSPCMNGGHCLDAQKLPAVSFDAHGYKCNCDHGFAGRNCEVTLGGLGTCHSAPCMHDGRCVDILNNNDPDLHFDYDHEFKCFCPALFSGKLCEVPFPACHSSPCLHNGTCFDKTHDTEFLFDDTGYECKCAPGYEGKDCQRQYAMNVMDDNVFGHQQLSEATVFDSHHQLEDHLDDDTIHPDIVEGNHHTGHHPGEDLHDSLVTDPDEDSNPHHTDDLHHSGSVDHKLDETHGRHGEPIIVHHPTHDEHKLLDTINDHHSSDGNLHTTDVHHSDGVDNFIHQPSGNMQHLVLPNHSTTPQPVIDTVAHHPANALVTNEQYDYPFRNPSPTMPITLKAGQEMVQPQRPVQRSVAQPSFQQAYMNYKRARMNPTSQRVNSATNNRFVYGPYGRRSGIARRSVI